MNTQESSILRFYIPICMVQFLVAFEFSVINVAIPKIQADFSIGIEYSQWLLSAYAISFASFLLLGGRITDIIGTKSALVYGLCFFIIATVASALCFSYPLLLFTRIIQGLSAATIVPAALRLITETTKLAKRNKILSWWGASASIGFALGVSLGGMLVYFLSWRAVFWGCSFIGILILLSMNKNIENRPSTARVDLKGFLLFFIFSLSGVSSITLAIDVVYRELSIYFVTLSLVSLIIFIIVEHRARQPVFPKGFFKNKYIIYSNFFNLFAVICGGSMVYFIAEYCNRVLDWSELHIGLSLIPDALAAAIGAKSAEYLFKRFGGITSLIIGFLFMTTGMFGLAFIEQAKPFYFMYIIFFTSFVGFGLVLTGVICTILASHDVNDECHGVSAGLINATQQWGLAIGLAVLIYFSKGGLVSFFNVEQVDVNSFMVGGEIGLISLAILFAQKTKIIIFGR